MAAGGAVGGGSSNGGMMFTSPMLGRQFQSSQKKTRHQESFSSSVEGAAQFLLSSFGLSFLCLYKKNSLQGLLRWF